MISQLVMTRVRHLLLTLAALFKKLLCCFSRRRRPSSGSGGPDCGDTTLSSINVVRDSGRYKNVVEKDWNSWDDTPATVEEHIERYREKLVAPVSPPEPPPEEQIDFFQDMAPKIVTQTKICIATDGGGGADSQSSQFARLTASNIDIPVGDGLDDWEDEEGGRGGAGWDDADENTTKQLIRETRKELRHQRQQQARNHHHYQK